MSVLTAPRYRTKLESAQDFFIGGPPPRSLVKAAQKVTETRDSVAVPPELDRARFKEAIPLDRTADSG